MGLEETMDQLAMTCSVQQFWLVLSRMAIHFEVE